MALSETADFCVLITLSTEEGELPDDSMVAEMVKDHFDDLENNVRCLNSMVIYRDTEGVIT